MTITAKIIESAEWESRIGLQAIIARLGHCCRCREIRPARLFGKSTALKSGLRSWCRFCEAELERKRRAKIKAKKQSPLKTDAHGRSKTIPDFSMCSQIACNRKETCKRSPASGTKSGPRQSWIKPPADNYENKVPPENENYHMPLTQES